MFRRHCSIACVIVGTLVACLPPARALVVENSAGTITAPAGAGNDPGWLRFSLSGSRNYVYLGDGWALSARHVGALGPNETIQFFNGTSTVSLGMIPNQSYIVHNPATILSSTGQSINLSTSDGALETDLRLIRLNGDPGFAAGTPSFTIAEQPLAVDDDLLFVGHGRSQVLPKKYWNSAWQEVAPGSATYSGYASADPNDDTKRWGVNDVANANEYGGSNAFYQLISGTTGVLKLKTPDTITRNVIAFGASFTAPAPACLVKSRRPPRAIRAQPCFTSGAVSGSWRASSIRHLHFPISRRSRLPMAMRQS